MKIPLCKPSISPEEIEKVNGVLRSGWLAHGPMVNDFEKNFSDYIGVKHSISLNSCTSALQLALQAQNIKGEVIVPSFTFVASANAIVTAGAKPVFADIDYDTCNIDPERVEDAITPATEAIMPVHFGGQSCRMDEIMEIAEKHNLVVIEDSAETLGGEYNGKKTGSFGTGCFSFYPTKNITTGEGGMITTNNEKFSKMISALRGHGILSSTYEREKKEKPWIRAATYAGYNYRLCDILAAIGVVQLKKVDMLNEQRRKHSFYLNKNIASDKIDVPLEAHSCRHVYQMYTIKVAEGIDRTKFILKLREKGVEASVHFDPPVHLQPYYQKHNRIDLSVTEDVSNRIVTLPMYPDLTKEELDFMIECVDRASS